MYPPKYVISLANKFVNGIKLNSSEFSGGKETNDFLSKLGFKIKATEKKKREPEVVSIKGRTKETFKPHNKRCPDCKNRIESMLTAIYGKGLKNFKFNVSTKVEDYKGFPYYNSLRNIFSELQGYRGHKDFVKASTLPNCDYYVVNPGFIVEFDESQHFSKRRLKSAAGVGIKVQHLVNKFCSQRRVNPFRSILKKISLNIFSFDFIFSRSLYQKNSALP